jgi:hypothetical protein
MVRVSSAVARKRSVGFIVIDTRSGEILSGLFTRREPARERIDELTSRFPTERRHPTDVEYRNGRFGRPLGIHKVELYPGETYDRETYRP